MPIRKAIRDYLIRRKVHKAFKQSHAYRTIKACTDNNVVISEGIASDSTYAPHCITWSKGMAHMMTDRDVTMHRVRDNARQVAFDSTPMAFCGPYLVSAAQASSGEWSVHVWNPIDHNEKFQSVNTSYGAYKSESNIGKVVIGILRKMLPEYFKMCSYNARLKGILEVRKGIKL